jgi:hypothetical protein
VQVAKTVCPKCGRPSWKGGRFKMVSHGKTFWYIRVQHPPRGHIKDRPCYIRQVEAAPTEAA